MAENEIQRFERFQTHVHDQLQAVTHKIIHIADSQPAQTAAIL